MPAPSTSVKFDSERSAAAEELRQRFGQGVDRLLAGLARGQAIADGVALEAPVPAVGELAGQAPPQLGRLGRVVARIARQRLVPLGDQFLARGHSLAVERERLRGNEEMLVRVPAVELLRAADFLLAKGRAVGLLGVVLGRRAVADVRPYRDQAGPLVAPRRLDRGLDRGYVVAILDPGRVPAVRVEALERPVGEGEGRGPVELDVVVVVQVHEPAQLQMARQRGRLGGDSLLEVAVGADGIHVVVDQAVAGPVELGRETALGNGHADAVGEALAERSGRGLDAPGVPMLGVAGRFRAPLAE